MTKSAASTILCLVFCFTATAQDQDLVQKLTSKTWSGKGALMGTDAVFEMKWSWSLDNAFLTLEFMNERMGSNGEFITFKANSFYKIDDEGEISGTWFDNRGITFPLSGKLDDHKMTINWGSPETEEGRTVYQLNDNGGITVTDYIQRDGEYLRFGGAEYK